MLSEFSLIILNIEARALQPLDELAEPALLLFGLVLILRVLGCACLTAHFFVEFDKMLFLARGLQVFSHLHTRIAPTRAHTRSSMEIQEI